MNFERKKIGIWGFGVVGKSMIKLLRAQRAIVQVYDSRALNEQELLLLKQYDCTFNQDLTTFLATQELFVVSPGVDMHGYQQYARQCVSELDIFYHFFQKPIIALTGTVGKTTSVHLIAQLLQRKGIANGLGGNVGYAMCDLIEQQDRMMYGVLELSSFQLEQAQHFAPHIAIMTNFYANHLDRHGDMQRYFLAKYAIIRRQQPHDYAIVHYALRDYIYEQNPPSCVIFFTDQDKPASVSLRPQDALFYVRDHHLYYEHGGTIIRHIDVRLFPHDTFVINYLLAYIVLHVIGAPLVEQDFLQPFQLPAHRVEKFLSHDGIDFYNDSKSTVPEATLAAVRTFDSTRLVLIIGGMSKGVDRAPFIHALQHKARIVFVFGKEAATLETLCVEAGIQVIACHDLQDLIPALMANVRRGDTVLFSPAGSSFDLFKHYEDRGNRFKDAVRAMVQKN